MCRKSVLFSIATEGPLSRPRWMRQEVRVATGAWLRPRNFRSRHKILVSRQDLTELCRDRAILCRDIVG